MYQGGWAHVVPPGSGHSGPYEVQAAPPSHFAPHVDTYGGHPLQQLEASTPAAPGSAAHPRFDTPDARLAVGDAVMATGLSMNATFNGLVGKIVGFQHALPGETEDQVLVVFGGGPDRPMPPTKPKALLVSNLVKVPQQQQQRDDTAQPPSRESRPVERLVVPVTKQPGESDLGCLLSDMVLRGVRADSPAERAGVARCVGMRLVEVDGVPVYNRTATSDLARCGSQATVMKLAFEGIPHNKRVSSPKVAEQSASPPAPIVPPVIAAQAEEVPDVVAALRSEVASLRQQLARQEAVAARAVEEARVLREQVKVLQQGERRVSGPDSVSSIASLPGVGELVATPSHLRLQGASPPQLRGLMRQTSAPPTSPQQLDIRAVTQRESAYRMQQPGDAADHVELSPPLNVVTAAKAQVGMPHALSRPPSLSPPPWERGSGIVQQQREYQQQEQQAQVQKLHKQQLHQQQQQHDRHIQQLHAQQQQQLQMHQQQMHAHHHQDQQVQQQVQQQQMHQQHHQQDQQVQQQVQHQQMHTQHQQEQKQQLQPQADQQAQPQRQQSQPDHQAQQAQRQEEPHLPPQQDQPHGTEAGRQQVQYQPDPQMQHHRQQLDQQHLQQHMHHTQPVQQQAQDPQQHMHPQQTQQAHQAQEEQPPSHQTTPVSAPDDPLRSIIV